MSRLTHSLGALALTSSLIGFAAVGTADAATATLTLLTRGSTDPFPGDLVDEKLGINSPALYSVVIDTSEPEDGENVNGAEDLDFEEFEGSTSFNYVSKFDLTLDALVFDPGASVPDGFLYPHYLFVTADVSSEDLIETFSVYDEPSPVVSYLAEISGCSAGPCEISGISIVSPLIEFPGLRFNQLTISVYNTAAIPIPGALPLFATGVAALGYAARRRKAKATA